MATEQGEALSLDDYFYGATTVGERGQVVIPAEARRECGLQPGDKLLVFRAPMHEGVSLVKVGSVHTMQKMMAMILERIADLEEEMANGTQEQDT